MIAKRILRGKSTGRSDFARLSQYMLNVTGRQSPATWERTADYILDTQHDGEKVGSIRITHCIAQDPAMAVAEIVRKQERNTRSKTDKTYHLVVSFPPGERPEEKVLHYIEDELCASIGFEDHQRISAVHLDTDHLHIHVAISKVHPETLSNIEPYYDKRKLMRTCARLEVELGLTRTHHVQSTDCDSATKAHLSGGTRDSVTAAPIDPQLSGVGDDAETKVQRRSGLTQKTNDAAPEAAASWQVHLELTGGAEGMEAHSGQVSFVGWLKERVPAVAQRAQSWTELHQALAEHGLQVNRRGAGLIFAGGGVFAKASDVDRSLSFESLTRRFGPYQARTDESRLAETQDGYQGHPKQPGAHSAALFAEYTEEREAALATRTARLRQLRDTHQRYSNNYLAWYQTERSRLRADPRLRGRGKLKALKELSQTRRQAFTARKQLEKEQHRDLVETARLPTWQRFLELRAAAGDLHALTALRSRARSQQNAPQNSIRVTNLSSSDASRLPRAPHLVRKNGDLEYRSSDGGLVVDTPSTLRVESPHAGAILLSLTLAQERFASERLVVDGSPEFGAQLAQVARAHDVKVQFADAHLEQLRCAPTLKMKAIEHEAIDGYIAERNNLRSRVSNLPFHQRWSTRDAGVAEYRGRRQMADGSQAVLLARGETVFVMPVTESEAAKATTWTLGTTVNVDDRGRFIEGRRREARR